MAQFGFRKVSLAACVGRMEGEVGGIRPQQRGKERSGAGWRGGQGQKKASKSSYVR